jgi:hypothetical protein
MSKDMIDDMIKRPVRQSMDGLNEVQFGIVFLIWGIISMTLKLWDSELPEWMSWSYLIVLPLAYYFRALSNRLRARWIAPRIGYVKTHSPILGKTMIAILTGGVIAVVVVIAYVKSPQLRLSMPLEMGVIFAVSNFILWKWLRVQRLLIYAILALASGLAIQWMVPDSIASEAFLCSIAVIYLIGGIFVVRNLIRLPIATEDSL